MLDRFGQVRTAYVFLGIRRRVDREETEPLNESRTRRATKARASDGNARRGDLRPTISEWPWPFRIVTHPPCVTEHWQP